MEGISSVKGSAAVADSTTGAGDISAETRGLGLGERETVSEDSSFFRLAKL